MSRRLLIGVTALLATAFLSFTQTAFAEEFYTSDYVESTAIDRFHEITPGLYRGARPTVDGMKFLADQGIKTILNLDNDPQVLEWEIKEAAKYGIKVISTPMSGFWRPKDAQVNKTLGIMEDEGHYPMYVHCQWGRDRTGLMTALFRVFSQNWDPAVAYDEMIDLGFRPALIFLHQYYTDRTGYAPPTSGGNPEYGN